MDEKKATSVRLSEAALRLVDLLAKRNGISKTAVLELAIRRMAAEDGVE